MQSFTVGLFKPKAVGSRQAVLFVDPVIPDEYPQQDLVGGYIGDGFTANRRSQAEEPGRRRGRLRSCAAAGGQAEEPC